MYHLRAKSGKKLKNKSSLRQHEKRHELTGKYKCTTCGLPTFSKFNYDRHDCEHKKKRNFKCTTCKKEFLTKRELERHNRREKNELESAFYLRKHSKAKHDRPSE